VTAMFQQLDDPLPLPASSSAERQAVIKRGTALRRGRRALAVALPLGVAAAVTAVAVGSGLAFGPRTSDLAPAGPAPAVQLAQFSDGSRLDPGRYVLSIPEEPWPQLPVLSVPEGFEAIDGGVGVRTPDFSRYVWIYTVDSVYTHPCQTGAGPEPVGPTVADLANALAAVPLLASTEPVPVTVGGYDGLYVELSVPTDVVAACPLERFNLWPERWQEFAGQVDMVWIVDVEGQRVVFDASHLATVSPEDAAEIKDMVTTATFVPVPGPDS